MKLRVYWTVLLVLFLILLVIAAPAETMAGVGLEFLRRAAKLFVFKH